MKTPPILYLAAFALLAGCGGDGGSNDSSRFRGDYAGTFTETTPIPNAASGTVALVAVDRNGKLTGTTTDSRYTGGGTIASGSKITSGGTVTLIVNYPSASPAVTTTARGTLTRTETFGLEGDLTEDGASAGVSGPTFHYVLTRNIN